MSYDNDYKHISVTQMNEILACPMMWYLKRRQKVEAAQPAVFILGSAVHAVAEAYLLAKEAGAHHSDFPLIDVLGMFEVAWNDEVAKHESIDWFSSIENQEASPDLMLANGKQMIAAFHKSIHPLLDPIQTEQQHWIDIPGCPGWRFTIKMDMVGVDEEGVYIADHKTAVFPWKKGKADSELQATASLWAWNELGLGPKTFRFKYNIVTKGVFGGAVKAYQEETTRTQADLDYFEEQMRQVVRTIKGAGFVMQPENKVHAWCQFKDACPAGHMFPKEVKEPYIAAEITL